MTVKNGKKQEKTSIITTFLRILKVFVGKQIISVIYSFVANARLTSLKYFYSCKRTSFIECTIHT